jgi:hypothetical protein
VYEHAQTEKEYLETEVMKEYTPPKKKKKKQYRYQNKFQPDFPHPVPELFGFPSSFISYPFLPKQ